MRPCTETFDPFLQYFATFSPFLPKTVMRCHSVCCLRSPDSSFQLREVARVKLVTEVPPWVWRVSGSWPMLPERIARFCMVVLRCCRGLIPPTSPEKKPVGGCSAPPRLRGG